MPYPKFKRYLAFHTDPKGFLVKKPSMESDLEKLQRIKEENKNLYKK
jgi:hypothetical protein